MGDVLTELRPGGEYSLHLEPPRAIEDAIRARPDWAASVTRWAVERHGAGVEYRGSGLGWDTDPDTGEADIVYIVRVRILPADEQPLEVEHSGIAIPVAVLVGLIAAALAIASINLRRTVEMVPPEDRAGIGRGARDLGRAVLNLTLIAAGVLGLLALERYGVLRRG